MSASKDPFHYSKYVAKLPVDGSEDGLFSEMGIDFGPFVKGDVWRGANLPSGWSVKPVPGTKSSVIVDQHSHARATIYVTDKTIMRTKSRFRVGRDPYIKNPTSNVRFCIWDSAINFLKEPMVVFEKQHSVPDRNRHSSAHESRILSFQKEFEKEAHKWLQERYPQWESPIAHWDDDIKKDKK
jgi:hypothetical protein